MTDPQTTERQRTRPLIARIWRATGEQMRNQLHDAGYPELAPSHNVVLTRAHGTGSRITEMAAQVGATKVAVTLLVNQLEELGYVRRVPDPDDRRAKLVQLTNDGTAAARALAQAADAVEQTFLDAVGPSRLARLTKDLEALMVAAERHGTLDPPD
jgi:DNA-binding MarR family transcriptional regulator